MRIYAIQYANINPAIKTVSGWLYLGMAESLDEARENANKEMNTNLNVVLDGKKITANMVFKAVGDRRIEIPDAKKEVKIKVDKVNYAHSLEYARDNFCRFKVEKELINKIIKRCEKK